MQNETTFDKSLLLFQSPSISFARINVAVNHPDGQRTLSNSKFSEIWAETTSPPVFARLTFEITGHYFHY